MVEEQMESKDGIHCTHCIHCVHCTHCTHCIHYIRFLGLAERAKLSPRDTITRSQRVTEKLHARNAQQGRPKKAAGAFSQHLREEQVRGTEMNRVRKMNE